MEVGMVAQDRISQEVTAFVVENFMFGDGGDLQATDSLIERGLIDSTGILELVAFLEKKYGIQIQDHELVPDNLDSTAALSAFVKRKLDVATLTTQSG
jgi:acyl carrier protein